MADAHAPSQMLKSAKIELQNTTDFLAQKLDNLFEQYLDLLDQYTTLREELSKTFSAGFFSLAQAQRTSSLGSGRRYGQDCYDERMKAQRRVTVGQDGKDGKDGFEVRKPTKSTASEHSSASQASKEKGVGRADLDLDGEKPSKVVGEMQETEDNGNSIPKSKTDPADRDPITWFGILVPPALRQTQLRFVTAAEKVVPNIVSIQARMQKIEAEIEAVRTQLSSLVAEREDSDSEREETSNTENKKSQDTRVVDRPKRSDIDSRRKLTSRPVHSKTPLLKIDG